MIASVLLAALLQAVAPDPLAPSFAGWRTAVENDLGDGDSPVRRVVTAGCTTTIVGERGRWTVDWRTVETVATEDVFVFLKGPGLQLAVVADVRDATGRAKLAGMRDAMVALAARCRRGGASG